MKEIDSKILVLLMLSFCIFNFNGDFAVTYQCEWWKHITFNFVHGNMFHLAVNVLCIYSIMTKCNIKLWQWCLALLLSFSLSFFCTLGKPLVGFSGVLFAVCGFTYAKVDWELIELKRKLYIAISFIIPFVVGFFFGQGSALLLHILCFAFGYGVQLLADYISSVSNDERRIL